MKLPLVMIVFGAVIAAGSSAAAQTGVKTTTATGKAADTAIERDGDDADLEKTLIAIEKQSWVAWKNRDGKFFERFLSEDHVEVHSDGIAGKANVVNGVFSPSCTVESYSVDNFKFTRLEPTVALLTYHAAQQTLCGGMPVPSPAWTSSLYIKRDGHWFNALYQQSPAK